MKTVIHTCDLCGKEYKNRLNWTLERDTFLTEDFSDNRKVVMEICGECARFIKRARGKTNGRDTVV